MAARPPRQWLLVGLACGLLAVLLVRGALLLLLASVKLLAVLAVVGGAWLLLRRPRSGPRVRRR